jgi:hypothetical protein
MPLFSHRSHVTTRKGLTFNFLCKTATSVHANHTRDMGYSETVGIKLSERAALD